MNSLHTRVKTLLNRLEQLAALLKKAGITIPNEVELEFTRPKLWSNKITPGQSEKIAKKIGKTTGNFTGRQLRPCYFRQK